MVKYAKLGRSVSLGQAIAVVRLVLFDIDGTLIRTGGAGVRAFAQAAELAFQRPEGTRSLDFAGRTDTGLIREFLRLHGFRDNEVNIHRFREAYLFLLDAHMEVSRGDSCPGVDEFIDQLAALDEPPVMGLLTGNVRLGAEIKLRHHQMWEWFEMGAFGDDHEDRNHLAKLAMDRAKSLYSMSLTGEEVLVIGDTPRDIECAAAIGAKCLAVATGKFTASELREYRPTWTTESLADLQIRDLCG